MEDNWRIEIENDVLRRTAMCVLFISFLGLSLIFVPITWVYVTLTGAVKSAAYSVVLFADEALKIIQDNWEQGK